MKRGSIAAVVLASFAGVFGALQLDHYFSNRNQPVVVQSARDGNQLFNVNYSSDIAPAPFDFRAPAKRASQSVVSIDQYRDMPLDFFGDRMVRRKSGTGSGVILGGDGLIVTNNHVVTDPSTGRAAPRLTVRLPDNRTVDAKVVGTDPRSDLAVIRVDAKNLVPIEVGTSKTLEVGQWVLAVGNPLGFDDTVSVGVVSSLKRNLPVGTQGLVDAIQTDAAINPGNSGGALCNAQGQLIGINSAIASSTGMSVGIGFAIPVDRVKDVVSDIVKYGYARYAGLGVRYRGDLEGALGDPDIRAQIAQETSSSDVPNHGLIIWQPGETSQTGFHHLDVLLSVDDQPIEGTFDLNKVLVPKKPGDKVNVKYWSKGKIQTRAITLQEVHQSTPQ